jgi:FkbM family methyltransferase
VLNLKSWIISTLGRLRIYISRVPIVSSQQFVTNIENEFIKKTKGVLHIGAHLGQEGERYFQNSAKVIWVEAIPRVYEDLVKNVSRFPDQIAVCALLGDQNNLMVDFNLASNGLASSSLFKFGNELGFKNIAMKSKIELPMTRLDNIYTPESIEDYEHWVLDVQGAELLVLKGAGNLLENCKSVLIEVSTRQVYEGGVSWKELEKFLSEFNLIPLWQPQEHSHENILFFRHR